MTKNCKFIELHNIVQLNPETTLNIMFAGCLMVVTELRDWGVIGYVQALGHDNKRGGQAYYRAKWDEIELCGRAEWVLAQDIKKQGIEE